MRTFSIVLAGEPGSGKTVTMASFVPRNADSASRLIIDMEFRLESYSSSDHGKEGDDAAALLFDVTRYPGGYSTISMKDFINLRRVITGSDNKPAVIGIDNIALFQDEMQGWCATAQKAGELAGAFGVREQFSTFLKFNFKPGEPNWWKLMQSVCKQFLIDCKQHGVNFVGTTELKNVWVNYGKRGRDPKTGQQYQKIVGKTSKMWKNWLQLSDAVWVLSRRGEKGALRTVPIIELDRFSSKGSIVGVPPRFEFTGWPDIWAMERTRGVPSQSDLDKLPEVLPEYAPDSESDTGEDPLETGKKRLIEELSAHGYTRDGIATALRKLGIEYTLDTHASISKQLLAAKS